MDSDAIAEAIRNSLETEKAEEAKNSVSSFDELKRKLTGVCNTNFWTVVVNDESVMFLRIESAPAPHVKFSVTVQPDLSVSVSACLVKLPSGTAVPDKVRDIPSLSMLLENIEKHSSVLPVPTTEPREVAVLKLISCLLDELLEDSGVKMEEAALYEFLKEQICPVLTKNRRYTPELLVFSSILHSISPHAYHFTRSASKLILPHPSTLRRLCSKYGGDPAEEQNKEHFLSYIRERSKLLKHHEKTVSLMIDEIHVKPYFDYKGGSVVGSSVHSTEPATTAHVFMIQSLLSPNKDVIHILPVSKMAAETLHGYTKGIILKLEEIGLQVVAVITDNNALNRKMMSLFAKDPHLNIVCPHPADVSRPLFYVVDPVNLLKCIRNNWINQKNPGTCFYYPEMSSSGVMPDGPPRMKAASFEAVRKLYLSEKSSLVKVGYKLNAKAVNPTSM